MNEYAVCKSLKPKDFEAFVFYASLPPLFKLGLFIANKLKRTLKYKVYLLVLYSKLLLQNPINIRIMKISRKKFVSLFLLCGFTFLFIFNVIVRSALRLIPKSGESFMGTESLTGWRSTVSTILYPIKIVLVGPMLPMMNLPDPPPPFLVIGLAFYWTILALVIYYLIGKIKLLRPKP